MTSLPNNSSPANCRLLLVDDNQQAAWTLSLVLKHFGYQVHTCYDGPAALAAAHEQQPDVILLDLAMPGQDGYQTCRMLRQEPWGQAVWVIALSGYGQAEDRQRTLEAGFDHHLVKPVDMNVLISLLTSLSEQKRGRPE